MKRLPWTWFRQYEPGFWHFGRWEIGVFDDGWVIARDQVIKLEGAWPTYGTFHKRR